MVADWVNNDLIKVQKNINNAKEAAKIGDHADIFESLQQAQEWMNDCMSKLVKTKFGEDTNPILDLLNSSYIDCGENLRKSEIGRWSSLGEIGVVRYDPCEDSDRVIHIKFISWYDMYDTTRDWVDYQKFDGAMFTELFCSPEWINASDLREMIESYVEWKAGAEKAD